MYADDIRQSNLTNHCKTILINYLLYIFLKTPITFDRPSLINDESNANTGTMFFSNFCASLSATEHREGPTVEGNL